MRIAAHLLARTWITVVTATFVVTLCAAPASAHQNGYRANGAIHSWCFGDSINGVTDVRSAMSYAMANLDNQTRMIQNGPVACADNVDIQFVAGSAGGNRGFWECVNYVGTTCIKARVTINRDVIAVDGGPLGDNLRKTACHEIGHSVGLDHHPRPGDCMVTGAVSAGSGQNYGGGHVEVINGLY